MYRALLQGPAAALASSWLSTPQPSGDSRDSLSTPAPPLVVPVAVKVVPLMVNEESYDAKSLMALRQEIQVCVWGCVNHIWLVCESSMVHLVFKCIQSIEALIIDTFRSMFTLDSHTLKVCTFPHLTFPTTLQVLGRLRHPNIVSFLGAYLSPPNVCIVEELAEGGSLHTRLHSRDRGGLKVHPPLTLDQV